MREFNRALELIEQHLREPIDMGQLARSTATSEYHFRRMFSSLAGMPISEYIRRRRLTVATAEILDGTSVLDVAVRYGYGSAEAFTRAFRAMHGIGPIQAREPNAVLHSQPRMKFHLRVEGSIEMEHRIVDKPSFRLIGATTRVPLVYSGPNSAIQDFERGLDKELDSKLLPLANTEPAGRVSATVNIDPDRAEGSELDYWHAVASTAPVPEGVDYLEVQAGLWVVFWAEGPFPESLQNLWAGAATEWFPANPYRWIPGPEMLLVVPDATGTAGRGELWIPVEREESE